MAARALEDGVHAGDLGVPRQRDLARRATTDVHQRRLVRERHDPLTVLAVAEQHERGAGALGRQPVDDLAGGLGTQRRGRLGFHGATLVAPYEARSWDGVVWGYAIAAGDPSCAYSG